MEVTCQNDGHDWSIAKALWKWYKLCHERVNQWWYDPHINSGGKLAIILDIFLFFLVSSLCNEVQQPSLMSLT